MNYMRTAGTRTMTFKDCAPVIEWRGKYDPTTGIIILTGKSVDLYRFDRWADDGGRAWPK